jgi:hypothetical protein
MRRRTRGTTYLAALVTAITVAGCGTTHIDKTKVQHLVRATLKPAPRSVFCPSRLQAKSGATFTCQLVYADGDIGQLTIHELDGDGHVEASPGDMKILTIGQRHARTVLLQLVAKNHVGLHSVSCPDNSPASGGTLTCHVIDIHGLHATVTEHIGAGGALAINPASDLHVQLPPGGIRRG